MNKFKVLCPHCNGDITIKNEKVVTGAESTDLISWTDKFSLGIPEIDVQHKGFIDIINKIHLAVKNDQYEEGFIPDCIKELNDYMTNHFATEEQLFSSTNYPDVEYHKKKHQNFITYINILNVELESTVFNFQPALQFLVKWFIQHIAGVDRGYVDYVIAATV